ncbi:hypothetical protein [Enhygromyxa salina]|uniref:hypothetical protein n=1 Tax=Enhygromyxa salina TaxID=215803 RepID=UPI0011B25A23|nr:hypothetical protein [Enhygromyxa salina]
MPWHEAQARLAHDEPTLEVEQLRWLIAEVPGVATSLRALLFELGEAASLGFVADAELAERVANQIRRGYLRVETEPDVPMSSDEVQRFDWSASAPESEPLGVIGGDHHWVEVELVDESGAPVADERCRIVLPNGSERVAHTNHDGLVRIDRTVAGSCTITFPELDAEATASLTGLPHRDTEGMQGVQGAGLATGLATGSHHWVEVELVDESGAGVAGEPCEIRLPTGELLRQRTDARGLVRIPSIAAVGDCEIRFPELDEGAVASLYPVGRQDTQTTRATQATTTTTTTTTAPLLNQFDDVSDPPAHWIEVELVDESGAGVAGELCEIKLPTGEQLRLRTDARGLIRVPRIAAAGDCTISFVELDAMVWDELARP